MEKVGKVESLQEIIAEMTETAEDQRQAKNRLFIAIIAEEIRRVNELLKGNPLTKRFSSRRLRLRLVINAGHGLKLPGSRIIYQRIGIHVVNKIACIVCPRYSPLSAYDRALARNRFNSDK